MPDKVNRVIIDTNLWISFLITKDFTKLDEIIFSRNCILIFSKELLTEFLDVIKRPKLRRFFSSDDIENLLGTIEEWADFIEVNTQVNDCRDPKDNFLLSLSIDGKADYLLTGDKDLLDLIKYRHTNIITITEFLQIK